MIRVVGIFMWLLMSVLAHVGIPPTLANISAYCITLISGIAIGILFAGLRREDENARTS